MPANWSAPEPHHDQCCRAVTNESVVVPPSNDWDVPEPWEVVKVASDGAEVVVERTPTHDQARSKAAKQKTA